MTEYTSFLARDGINFADRKAIEQNAHSNYEQRAVAERSGRGAVNQSHNFAQQQRQTHSNARNAYLDENMNRVEIATVQQIQDRTFFRRNNRWVDTRILENEEEIKADVVITDRGEAFDVLVELLAKKGITGIFSLEGAVIFEIDGKVYYLKLTDEE